MYVENLSEGDTEELVADMVDMIFDAADADHGEQRANEHVMRSRWSTDLRRTPQCSKKGSFHRVKARHLSLEC